MKYDEFLESKFHFTQSHGFDMEQSEIHPMLYPHQRDLVQWAVKRGRAAIFAAFGLGKSMMQIEILRAIARREGGRQLIIAPLGVRQEFFRAEYFKDGLRYLRQAERETDVPTLFDMVTKEVA